MLTRSTSVCFKNSPGFSKARYRTWKKTLLCGTMLSLFAGMAGESRAATIKGWWRLDGNFKDETGNGMDGTAMGDLTFDAATAAALTGQSLLFNDDSEGVRIAASPALASQEFTLGYFINLQGVSSANSGLERLTAREGYQFETAVGDGHAVRQTTSPTGITLSYYGVSTGAWQITDVAIPATGWVHVTWRNSASEMQLYVDGELVYTGLPAIRALTGFMNFGTSQYNGEGFSGLMDDAFFSDGLLTAEEIKKIATEGVAAVAGNPDADSDGLPGVWETQYGLDPNDGTGVNGADGDGDNDGLTNTQEFALGLDPTKADTDGDGLKDGEEATYGTNPLVADTDGDGLKDGDEVARHTNPLEKDTDGDGADDATEVAFGSDPLEAASMPPPSAYLVLWLKFDEGDARDSSPKGNNGTLMSTPSFVEGDSPGGGTAMSLSANPQGVQIPASASLSSPSFTLSYWVKPTSLQEGNGVERLTGRDGFAFETAIGNRSGIGGAPDLTLSYYQGSWINTNTSLVLNEWAHVAWRHTPAEGMSLWVNGVKVFMGAALPAGRPGSGQMGIGTRPTGSEGFEGMMDDVRLYALALPENDMPSLAVPATQGTFEITTLARSTDGSSVTLKFRSQNNRTYAVDYCTDLRAAAGTPGSWVELSDSIPATGAETEYVDLVGAGFPRAFYRVRDVTAP